jgi:hypothetical protein
VGARSTQLLRGKRHLREGIAQEAATISTAS